MELLPNPDSNKNEDVEFIAHRLPCTVHFDGPLPTARAFCPFPKPMQTFRGRKLESAIYNLPSSSHLVMIEKKKKKGALIDEGRGEAYEIKKVLRPSIVHYEHDNPPADNASIPLALRWLELSDALHAPVDPEQMKEEKEVDGKVGHEKEVEGKGKGQVGKVENVENVENGGCNTAPPESS